MPIRLGPRLNNRAQERATPSIAEQETLDSPQQAPPAIDAKTAFEPPYLSLREAAEWLCVSLSTIKRMVARGTLSTVRIGERNKVPANVLEAYVARDVLIPGQHQQDVDHTQNRTDASNT